MGGYIGTKASVTQVDGYNRTEADDRYVNAAGDTMTGALHSSVNNHRAFVSNSWAEVSGGAGGSGFFGSNSYVHYDGASTISYKYSQSHGGIGSTGMLVNYPAWNKGSLISAGTTSATQDSSYTPVVALTWDEGGRVTTPSQPIWGGRHSGGNLNDFVTMYNDASVTNGSGWVLAGGNGERLYPPVSGWYQITMTGLANQSVNISGHTQAYLYKSGVSQYNLCAGTTDYTRMIIHAYLYLTPTDWISFYTGGTAMHTDQAYNKVTCMLVA